MSVNVNAQPKTWMTLLTVDDYLPGVLCLARGLRRVSSGYPLSVLHTGRLSAQTIATLKMEGISLVAVEPFMPHGVDPDRYLKPIFAECWTKLRMWQLDSYARIGYLDADMLPMKNFDDVLEAEDDLMAVRNCFCGMPPGERDRCPQVPENENRAFNAGFLVLRPDPALFRRWEKQLEEADHSRWRMAEQDFLNEQYEHSYVELPRTYNMNKYIFSHHSELWRVEEIKCLHFVLDKPWQSTTTAYAEIEKLWWDTYTDRHTSPELVARPTQRAERGLL